MRCRIRAALSSTLPSLAQEHALHFQSTTPTIWKRLTLWKTTLTLFGCSDKTFFVGLFCQRCLWCYKCLQQKDFRAFRALDRLFTIYINCPKKYEQELCLCIFSSPGERVQVYRSTFSSYLNGFQALEKKYVFSPLKLKHHFWPSQLYPKDNHLLKCLGYFIYRLFLQ